MAQNTKNIKHRKVSVEREKQHHTFLFIFLILVITAAIIYALVFFAPRGSNSSELGQDPDASQSNQKIADNQTSEPINTTEKSTEPQPESEKNHPQYEGNNPNLSEGLTGIINYASIADSTLSIRVSIEQSVSGTCTFTIITPTGRTVTGQGAITAGPSSAFCSFSTPATESGTWKISVNATSADKYGIITGEASN